jgi:hypothetical protein
MAGWLRYLELRIQAKTGLTSGILVWAVVAALCGALAFAFVIVLAYLALADGYGPLIAALLLAAFFLFIAIIAVVTCLTLQRRTMERAKLALVLRKPAPWRDPKFLGVALQTGRTIGWRKLVPLLAIPLAAGVGLQWYSNRRLHDQIPPE